MSWLISWLIKWLLESVDNLLDLIDALTIGLIEQPIMTYFVDISIWLGWIFFAIGTLISFTKISESIAQSENPNLLAFAKSLILGVFTIAIMNQILVSYKVVTELSNTSVSLILGSTKRPDNWLLLSTTVDFTTVMLVVFVFVVTVIVFFNTLERLGMLVSYIMVMSLSIMQITTGNNNLISSIGLKIGAIFFVQFIQRSFFAAGLLNLYNNVASNDYDKPQYMIATLLYFTAAWKVPQKIDNVLSSALGGKGFGGLAMQTSNTISMISRTMRG